MMFPFDVVVAECPACGAYVEFRSAGSTGASWRVFGQDDVPGDVVSGELTAVCPGCRRGWSLLGTGDDVGADVFGICGPCRVVSFDDCGREASMLFEGEVPACVAWIERERPAQSVAIHHAEYGAFPGEVQYTPAYRLAAQADAIGDAKLRITFNAAHRRTEYFDLGIDIDQIEADVRARRAYEPVPGSRTEDHEQFRFRREVGIEVARAALERALSRTAPCPFAERLVSLSASAADAVRVGETRCMTSFGPGWGRAHPTTPIAFLGEAERGEVWGLPPGSVPRWRVVERLEVTPDGFVLAHGVPLARFGPVDEPSL